MDAQHRSIQVLSSLAIVLGCYLALMLVLRLIVEHISNFWILFSEVLFACLATYLIYIGRRGLAYAKARPLPRARFGWGRILFAGLFSFSSANARFHLVPTATILKPLEPSNPTQAAAMEFMEIFFYIVCFLVVVSGIWRGFRRSEAKSSS